MGRSGAGRQRRAPLVIVLARAAAPVFTMLLSLVTACVVVVRGVAMPSRATVGEPRPGIGARAVANRVRHAAGRAHRALAPVLLAVGTGVTGLRLADLRPVEAVACHRGPVLVASGTDDRHTTIAEARTLHVVALGQKENWEVAGARHVDMAQAAGIDYERRIVAFFGRHLTRDASCA